MASQAKRATYREKKLAERDTANATTTEPEVYANAMIAMTLEHCTLTTEGEGTKPWIINSGCSAHFSPNKSEFLTYTPYMSPQKIRLGDSRVMPSLGEGTVSIACLVNGKLCTCLIHGVQYVPALAYALLSCKALSY